MNQYINKRPENEHAREKESGSERERATNRLLFGIFLNGNEHTNKIQETTKKRWHEHFDLK